MALHVVDMANSDLGVMRGPFVVTGLMLLRCLRMMVRSRFEMGHRRRVVFGQFNLCCDDRLHVLPAGGRIAQAKEETPHCPVQLHFGEKDPSISMNDVRAIQAAQLGVEIFTYSGVGHGFGCDERAMFDPNAYSFAQERTLAFLEAHL